jgi:hypothetical protein
MSKSTQRGNPELQFSGRNNPGQSARGAGATVRAPQASARNEISSARSLHDQYGLEAERDPLQLEHALGYSGNYRRTVHSLLVDEETFIKR